MEIVGLVWQLVHYAVFSPTLGHCYCSLGLGQNDLTRSWKFWDSSSSSDVSGACSTDSDDVPRNMTGNALGLPPLSPLYLMCAQDLLPYCPWLAICSLHCMAAAESCLAKYQAEQEWYG